MDSKTLIKLRIYAMAMRLSELEAERHRRMLQIYTEVTHPLPVLDDPYKFELTPKHEEYFVPKKIHPKHQNRNKRGFHK